MTAIQVDYIKTSPIFLYSGFRASSTWLWSKFRAHEALRCYYEPFNEQLARLTPSRLEEDRPEAWRSRHPASGPYSLEYAEMLGDGAGVPNFPDGRSIGDRYIGKAGLEGPLDEDVAAYVQGLIDHAKGHGQVPMLACTRVLGRAAGMRAAFGGYHILLVRNLFHQWNSFAGQARFGNWYFFNTLFETLQFADRDPVIASLAQVFPESARATFEQWVRPENFDRAFCYFVAFHLYFLTIARRSSDLVIDVNALAAPDGEYRQNIIEQVHQDIGIFIDLDDVCEQVDFPIYPISDKSACSEIIESLSATIKVSCGVSSEEHIFIDMLMSDLWREQAAFQRQTSGAFEYCTRLSEENGELERVAADHSAALDRQLEASRLADEAAAIRLAEAREEGERRLADIHARLAESAAECEALKQKLAREREESAQHAGNAARELQHKTKQLAEAKNELRLTRKTLGNTVDALAASQLELKQEQERAERFEKEIRMIENVLANVSADNLDLAGRISFMEQANQRLNRRLANEQAKRVRSEDRLQHVLNDDGPRDRLMQVLSAIQSFGTLRSLYPDRLWRRKLRDRLAGVPGFENAFSGTGNDITMSELAECTWKATIGEP